MIQIDMEMPKGCMDCPCESAYGHFCNVNERRFTIKEKYERAVSRPSWCPLKEVDEDDRK